MSTYPVQEIRNEVLGDSYFEIQHPSGLKIVVYPKPGYASTYAVFGTNYGSIDTFLKTRGSDARAIPEGTAHYLEHKLFESEELDAFARFAKTGASANAYTSFDKTCYLFSCSSNFEENLKILIDFVQHPYFTEATVQKEQGIIGQEIRMYQDSPGWQVLFNLLRSLYHNHPVKIDIAGTVESISHITAELLYECYDNFYNLNNMVLSVAGNTTVEDVLRIADEVLEVKDPVYVERADYGEPVEIVRPYVEQTFPVSMPVLAMGFKEHWDTPVRTLREKLITDLILDYLAGDTSPLYNRLLNDGLVNAGFDFEYFTGYGYAAILFEGETADPEKLAEEIRKEVRRVKAEGLDPEEFERLRKMNYGKSIMDYNDIEDLANVLVSAEFEGFRLFDELEIYRTLTIEEVEAQLEHQLNEEYSALSVILPGKGEEA